MYMPHEEDSFKEEEEVGDNETYGKLSATPVTKRDI